MPYTYCWVATDPKHLGKFEETLIYLKDLMQCFAHITTPILATKDIDQGSSIAWWLWNQKGKTEAIAGDSSASNKHVLMYATFGENIFWKWTERQANISFSTLEPCKTSMTHF